MTADLLLDRFDLLFDSTESVVPLRAFILDLAVQGRLVPQDTADEPADTLLKRIEAEKQRLYRLGEIARPKDLPPLRAEERRFDLPRGWAWTRLGNLGSIVGGGTPKTDEPRLWSADGIPWLTPADLNGLTGKNIGRGRRCISPMGLITSSAQLLPAGAILFSSRAPIGYVAIAANPLATNQGFKSCVPFISDVNEYLFYFLKHAAKRIDAEASGTTFKEVSGKDVARIVVPLPPLSEQARIVTRVDKLMGLCDRLESLLARARLDAVHLRQAVLEGAAAP